MSRQRLVHPYEYAKHVPSLMAATDGLVAEFSSFANFEEKKRKSNLFVSYEGGARFVGDFSPVSS